MASRIMLSICLCLMVFLICGCTTSYKTRVDDTPGRPTTYEDIVTPGVVSGVGLESQDITSMTDKMMRDIMSVPQIVARSTPPLVIMDDEHFKNESSSRLNKKLITNRLRVGLNRASQGRMYFVGREHAEVVEKERLLKREGVVTSGTLGTTPATAGADFRLTGTIASLDSVAQRGTISRYHQITFELVDLESGIIAWSGMYEFRKSAQDDIVYR